MMLQFWPSCTKEARLIPTLGPASHAALEMAWRSVLLGLKKLQPFIYRRATHRAKHLPLSKIGVIYTAVYLLTNIQKAPFCMTWLMWRCFKRRRGTVFPTTNLIGRVHKSHFKGGSWPTHSLYEPCRANPVPSYNRHTVLLCHHGENEEWWLR